MAASPHLMAPQSTSRGVKLLRRANGQSRPQEPFLAAGKACAPTLVWVIPPHVPAPDVEPWTADDLLLCITEEDWEGLSVG